MRFIILSLALFNILLACGPKTSLSPTKRRTKIASSLLLLENGCKNGSATSDVYNATQDFIKTYDHFIKSGTQDTLTLANEVGKVSDHFKSSPFKPHVMGEASLQKKLDRNIKRFYELKESEERDLSLWNELAQELKRLSSLASRLKAQKCAIDRLIDAKKNDFRDYIELNEKKDLFICESNEKKQKCHDRFIKSLIEHDKRSVLRLCMRYHSKGFCGREFNRSFPNKLVTFFDHYFLQQEKEYKHFFKIKKKGPFQCQKRVEHKILTIKTKGFNKVWQKSFMSKDSFTKAVNKYWGIEGAFKIVFTEVDNDEDMTIKFEDSMISFVEGDNSNSMILSKGLAGNQLLSVFTHELGHVFGFKDCYVEFFNRKTQNLIYYTLDADQPNLMCEITQNSIIPLSYKKQLLESYCKNK